VNRHMHVCLAGMLALLLAVPWSACSQPASLVGSAAPRISGTAADGVRVDVPVAGQVTVVAFWNSRYRLSLDALSGIERVYREYRSKGLVCVGVNDAGESSSSMNTVRASLGLTFPLVGGAVGPNAAAAYRLQGVPAVFIVDRSGDIDSAYGGWDKSVEAAVKQRVATLL
jgi:hypothetical protein